MARASFLSGGDCFSDGEGGSIFKWGGVPHGGGMGFDGGGLKKNHRMWGGGGVPPLPPPLGEALNPLPTMQIYNDNMKRPKLRDILLRILKIYAFFWKIQQRALGGSTAGVM